MFRRGEKMIMSNHTLLQRFKTQVDKLGAKTALIGSEGKEAAMFFLNSGV